MSQQNFVEQFRLFMEFARKKSMHARECMLWMSLFYFANEEATYNADTQTYDWPDDFFEVSNGELNSYGKFDKQAVESLRNRLKQRGLIDFIKGERNAANPMYKINYLVKVGNKIIPNIQANSIPNIPANHSANSIPNTPANHSANPTAHSININNIYSYSIGVNEDNNQEEEDEEEQERARAEADVREELTLAWRENFGTLPKPGMIQDVAQRIAPLGFERGVISRALHSAALRDADSPCDYMLTLLADWAGNKVRTLNDLDEYCALRDMRQGKLGYGQMAEAGERLKAFREDRETPEEREVRVQQERRLEAERERRRAEIADNESARREAEYARKLEQLNREYSAARN